MCYLERRGKPKLHYDLDDFTDPWAEAKVLILQHGYGRSSRFWYSWVPYLTRFYKVVRPDLRGLGQSQEDFDLEKELTVDAYIEDLIAIFDALGADSVHYCGESLGGILGIILAAEYPQRVKTLTLVSAPVYISKQAQRTFAFHYSSWQEALKQMGSRGWAEAVNSAFRFPSETDPGLLQWYAEEMGRSKVDVLIAMSRLACQVDVTPYLSRIKTPVLGLYPSSSMVTEQEDLLTSSIPNINIVHVASRYHTIQNTAPAACANHVLHFVSQYDGINCHE